MDRISLKTDLTGFIKKEMPNLKLDEKLFDQLNSLDVISFFTIIEKKYQIEIHPMEYDPQILQSFESLVDFVQKKIEESRDATVQ